MRQPAIVDPTPTALRSLIAAIPLELLRKIVLDLLLAKPTGDGAVDGAVEKRKPRDRPRKRSAAVVAKMKLAQQTRRNLEKKRRRAAAKGNGPIKAATGRPLKGAAAPEPAPTNGGKAAASNGAHDHAPDHAPETPAAAEDPRLSTAASTAAPRPAASNGAVKSKQARRKAAVARRRAARAAVRAAQKPTREIATAAEQSAAATLWDHASKLDERAPYKAAAAGLNINRQVAVDAYRGRRLPPGVTGEDVNRFVEA